VSSNAPEIVLPFRVIHPLERVARLYTTASVKRQGEPMVEVNPNFAKEVIDMGGTTVNLCYQCGTCTASCPSGRQTSFRTRSLIKMTQLGMREEVLSSSDLWMCTTCYTCQERCPRGVEIVDVITALRNIAVAEGHMQETHKKVATAFMTQGHTVKLNDEFKALRESMGLPGVPPTVLSDDKAMSDFKKIVEKTGFTKLVGGD